MRRINADFVVDGMVMGNSLDNAPFPHPSPSFSMSESSRSSRFLWLVTAASGPAACSGLGWLAWSWYSW